MRPIPPRLRAKLAADPFMHHCIHYTCHGKPEWEHAIIVGGKQLNEAWAIVPVCTFHHRGEGLDKQYNRYRAYNRATDADFNAYPKSAPAWLQEKKYLNSIYGK
jgi:hypothetical protein